MKNESLEIIIRKTSEKGKSFLGNTSFASVKKIQSKVCEIYLNYCEYFSSLLYCGQMFHLD